MAVDHRVKVAQQVLFAVGLPPVRTSPWSREEGRKDGQSGKAESFWHSNLTAREMKSFNISLGKSLLSLFAPEHWRQPAVVG